jgi:hypothetical protein
MTSRCSRDADIALRKNPEVNISKRQNKLSDTERLSFDIRLNFILICLAFVSPFVLANTKTRNSGGGRRVSDGVYDSFAAGSGSNGYGNACRAAKAGIERVGHVSSGKTGEGLGLSQREANISRESIAAALG